MAKIKAKGHEFEAFHVRDSFNRRAIQFRNNIAGTLRKIGLTEDDIDIPLKPAAIKNATLAAAEMRLIGIPKNWFSINSELH